MKTWREELKVDYNKREFGYASFCKLEKNDSISEIYNKGFLPMSEKDQRDGTFYRARSARVVTDDFLFSSENRRVFSKFDNLFDREEIPIDKFDTKDSNMIHICATYLSDIHKLNGDEKLQHIFDMNLLTDVSIYRDVEGIKAYVFLIKDKDMTHYWFSFFGSEMVKKSFGIYLILKELLCAKEEGKKYMYVGTCYKQKGRYKLNFQPLEFWDGNGWNQDTNLLKNKIKEEL